MGAMLCPLCVLIELGRDEDEVDDDERALPPTAIAPEAIDLEASQVAEDECEREDSDPNCEALLPPAITSEATIRVPTALGSREEPGIEQEATEHKEDLARNA